MRHAAAMVWGLVAACGVPGVVDDPVDAGSPDTEVADPDDSDAPDTGGGADDGEETDETDVDGFPDPITFLDDPLPGAWSDAFSLPGVTGGLGPRIQAVATLPDGRLVVGGSFQFVVRTPVSNLAVRDATGAWGPLGGGLDFVVEDLLVHDGDLWVVGVSQAPDGLLGQVALWDGVAWSRPAIDLDGRVNGVDLVNGRIHVTGEFTSIGGEAADGLAIFDGSRWDGIDDLFEDGFSAGLVRAFAGPGDELCVCGALSRVNGADAGGVACRRDVWEPWGAISGEVRGVTRLGDGRWMAWGALAVATEDDAFRAVGLAVWSGSAWLAPAEGGVFSILGSASVRDLVPSGPSGYVVAGEFTLTAALVPNRSGILNPVGIGIPMEHVARFDGSGWTDLGGGLGIRAGALAWDGTLGGHALHEDDGVLWVGGLFREAGGEPMVGLGGWDGTAWIPPFDLTAGRGLPGLDPDVEIEVGLDGTVWTLASREGVGASLSRWTGSDWEGPAWMPTVLRGGELRRIDGVVHLTGELSLGLAPCDVAAHVAPQRWRCVVTGLDGTVQHVGADASGQLVVAGGFRPQGGPTRIARWDGTSFLPLGAGLTRGRIAGIAVAPDGRVAVAGGGLESGPLLLGDLALWDGTAWSALAGLGGEIRDLAWHDDDLLVAGAGLQHLVGPEAGRAVGSVARWDGTAWSDLGGLVSPSGDVVATSRVVPSQGGVYVVGDLGGVGAVLDGGVAWFDGTAWAPLGVEGADGPVLDLSFGADDVWLVGLFQSVDGVASHTVARWVVGSP